MMKLLGVTLVHSGGFLLAADAKEIAAVAKAIPNIRFFTNTPYFGGT